MKIRTFWIIFIRTLGLGISFWSINVLMNFLSTLFLIANEKDSLGFYNILLLSIFLIGLYVIIIKTLIFNTTWVIDQLHLDKGFEEEKLDLNISKSTVLSIVIIVIGGVVFIDCFPQLCSDIYLFFQDKLIFSNHPQTTKILTNLIKTFLAHLLITKSNTIVAFIDKKTVNEEDCEEQS